MLIFIFEFIRGKILFLFLLIVYGGLFYANKYWLQSQLEEVSAQKSAIIARKAEEMNKLGVNNLIDILLSFAKVSSEGLWIHSMKIEQSNISLKIRSSDPKAIEKYVHEVVDIAHLKLESMVTKNIQYKPPEEEKEEGEQQQVVPFAVKLYLASLKEGEQGEDGEGDGSDENSDDSTKDTVFFSYEAEVKLSAMGH